MDDTARRDLVEGLLPLVRTAGAAVLRSRNAGLATHLKHDKSPVTSADIGSEAVIRRGCSLLFPAIPMISEERAPALESSFEIPPLCFLVDPLDGTKEFIAGRSEFTVNIALVENGVATAGVIFAPALDRLYVAAGPRMAFMIDENGRRIRLDGMPHDHSHPIVLASRSHLDEQTAALVAQWQPCIIKQLGSSLKFALIAAGEADVYPRLSPTMIWDSAAGQALIEATGGVVLRPNGSPLVYCGSLINRGFVAARTRSLAAKALASIDSERQARLPVSNPLTEESSRR
ncbi:3'(2'), 5'-bisphosphate nucleotidase [Sinorhizobium fredii]|uniref:3'(2'),5'-bisphosphate nucleotidase CysQ n=4 Tax=Sinorhizobium TaxID=28105 RepID=A0A844AFI1_RHIFR|nr:3'(2'),5'-bisphosphate nucleotidase CysQ [Sinorhizobium fredii]MQX11723.1 3'(2'),5'-bisphosphate nucleotidase CysQ [Sinorhizobium fredii]OAP35641.1 3'(2'),5'-bisphosphate nucleotidase CysQ [Sinorhizobium glycinis]CEO91737.1 3'-Phosphoadenosine-5'-phosphosulfate (PAPS) 3'-phosphatase-like protein [Sinorhizobium fredii HH103]